MLPLLPDAEVLVVDFLANHPGLTPLHHGEVATSLGAARPAIRVTRIAGPPPDPEEDNPYLQVDCWAATQDEASVLARTVIACLPDIEGDHAEGVIRGWEIVTSPLWAPDPDTDDPRYVLAIGLLSYPS